MIDLTEYIPRDDQWIDGVAEQIGWDELTEYYDRIYLMLQRMINGERFQIEKSVHPDNYQLFVRCACTAIRELQSMGIYGWSIEEKASVIVRVKF
jgi:hypothetical protein